MALDEQIQAFCATMDAGPVASAAPAAPAPEAFGDRLSGLVDSLREGLANIDESEASAILSKATEAAAAFAAGNWIAGTLAMLAAMRLYRQAKKD